MAEGSEGGGLGELRKEMNLGEGIGALGVLPRLIADDEVIVLAPRLPHLRRVMMEVRKEENSLALRGEVRHNIVLVHDPARVGDPLSEEVSEVLVPHARLPEAVQPDVRPVEEHGKLQRA
eukprot:758439-Hanusia_phi.AAC.2